MFWPMNRNSCGATFTVSFFFFYLENYFYDTHYDGYREYVL